MIFSRVLLLLLSFWVLPWTALAVGEAPVSGGKKMFISEEALRATVGKLEAKVGVSEKERLAIGVNQVARLWREEDGSAEEFRDFCLAHYVVGEERDKLFERFERNMEAVSGHFNSLTLQLRLEMDEDRGPLLPVDSIFGEYSPDAHFTEDMFKTKLAFIVLLNFPVRTLEELVEKGEGWSRRQWAEARLSQRFAHRVPAEVNQRVTQAYAASDNYINNYNVYMDRLVDKGNKAMFRKGLRLISHWGLRDELRALYVDPVENLAHQEMIHRVMERIIAQEIPAEVINNPQKAWDPVANTVDGKASPREPDTRYKHLLAAFKAHRLEDPYYPHEPSHILRRFNLHREIPEGEFVALLESVLKSPVSAKVARLVEKRLGRPLKPFDIWYDGFKARGGIKQSELDRVVKERYPNLEAFQRDLPQILAKLGFDEKTAAFLSDHIEVDPARGAGHAWGPQMRTEKAHLRTKVPQGGMDYKGFNIAMHELGHNVEQVTSLYRVDHNLLEGVPNTAFTEGFAFVFQSRDLDVLGLSQPDENKEAFKALDTFWSTREIGGVALVDIRVWHWMYDHPEATPEELRLAVTKIAKDVWNAHFAPHFGIKDSPILAIYSHMINSGLYLPDYPLGYLIAFQVEDYFKTHPLATEMVRMCSQGNIAPNVWMKKAVGRTISSEPLIQAVERAVTAVD